MDSNSGSVLLSWTTSGFWQTGQIDRRGMKATVARPVANRVTESIAAAQRRTMAADAAAVVGLLALAARRG